MTVTKNLNPQGKKFKVPCEIIGRLNVLMPEIGRKLAYNEKWYNGPGKEAVKSLLDGLLRSKLDVDDVILDWYVHVCVYYLLHISCRGHRG